MKNRVKHASYKEILLVLIILVLLTQNLFFEIYRISIFDAMPHDHYGPYLLFILGNELGIVPDASHAYRIISVMLAIPFYHILPLFTFTSVPVEYDDALIRSVMSTSFVSYLAVVITCMYSYLITRNRFDGDKVVAFITLLLTYLMMQQLREGLLGVDAVGVMVLTMIIYHLNTKVIYLILILLSAFINEKIPIVFFLLFLSRFFTSKEKRVNIYLVGVVISLCLYASVNFLFPLPGNEEHRNVAHFWEQFVETLILTLSMKGLLLNVLPVLILMATYTLAFMASKTTQTWIYFKKADIFPFFGLIIITHLAHTDYNVGRIVMYVFPLYLPLASMYIYRILKGV